MTTSPHYAALFSGYETDIASLEKTVHEHPESSFARFLLLLQYKKINDPDFEKLARQSVLHFSNPGWLRFQLIQTDNKAAAPLTSTASVEVPESPSEIIPAVSEDADDNGLIEFEPLHTVDYFASQGIKLSEEVLMNDKLGKQMKSFTEWLKSMKKLHPGKLPEQNAVIEKIIQTSAEESNTETGVLTEAMAEVLIKQNKKEKAIEMYEKLSLMNPAKSAYFATKIERIKTS